LSASFYDVAFLISCFVIKSKVKVQRMKKAKKRSRSLVEKVLLHTLRIIELYVVIYCFSSKLRSFSYR